MSKKMREENQPKPVAAIPNDAILLDDDRNWIVMPLSIKIKMKDWQRWVTADADADFDTSYFYLAKYVTAWSFFDEDGVSLDPTDVESWGELDLADYLKVNRAVSEHISGELKRKN